MTSQIWTTACAVLTPDTITAKTAIAANPDLVRKVIFSAPLSMSGPARTCEAASVNGMFDF